MRMLVALPAIIAGCAVTPSRQTNYDSMASAWRRDVRANSDGALAKLLSSGVLERRALLDAVLSVNRDVEAARQAWRASVAAVPAAGALADPMLSYEIAPLSIAGQAPYGQRIELRQRIPFPGKRSLAVDVAVAEAEAANGDFVAQRTMVADVASQLFDDAYANARATDVLAQHQTLVEQAKKVAEARVASGRGGVQDVLQAEVELAQLERERLMLETERVSINARLNGLLHREPGAALPLPPKELGLPAGPEATAQLESAALTTRAEQQSADARIRGAQAGAELAQRAYWPDFELMASYDSMWDMPEHRWMMGIAVDLPIQRSKRAADVETARARVAVARADRDRLVDTIRVEVARARQELDEAIATSKLYDARLVPAAKARIEAAIAGFSTGQNDFPAVIDAERGLRDIELAGARARADAWRRRAQLDRVTGTNAEGAP